MKFYLRFNKLTLPCLLLVVVFNHGCLPQTSFTGSKHCPPYLNEGDQILVNALQSENWEHHLRSLRRELHKRRVNVLYAPEEEWSLRAAGVVNPLDTTFYPILLKNGITHLLLIREANSSHGNVYTYKTPYELARELNPFNSIITPQDVSAHKVKVVMQLLALKTKQHYSFSVTTQVNGVEIRDKQGGATTVNAGSVDNARNVAIRKGAAKIAKNCR